MASSFAHTLEDNRRLFIGAGHAETYRLYRPTYPRIVVEVIMEYLDSSMSKPHRMAVDMGCGSGQATIPLTNYFDKVVGCDVSESQISEARRCNSCDKVKFHVAPAEDMTFIPNESVDLVTCALAFHYVDSDLVYPEVERILCKGGVLAIYAYGLPKLSTPETQTCFDEFTEAIQEFLSPQVAILSNRYRDLKLPLYDVQRKDDLSLEKDLPLSLFIGYLQSKASYQKLLNKRPNSNVLEVLSQRLRSVLPEGGDDPIIHLSFPLFIVMGRKG